MQTKLKHFYRIEDLFLNDGFIESVNEERKNSLCTRHNENYRIIKNYVINCVKNNKKIGLDVYDLPRSIIRKVFKIRKDIKCMYEMKLRLN